VAILLGPDLAGAEACVEFTDSSRRRSVTGLNLPQHYLKRHRA
jgi:hypothetical protein